LFIAIDTLDSLVELPTNLLASGKIASTLLLTAGLTWMGLGVKWRSLIQVGDKPLLVATSTLITVAAGLLGLIALLNVA
jgi:uncharacterized membrane protein YadS